MRCHWANEGDWYAGALVAGVSGPWVPGHPLCSLRALAAGEGGAAGVSTEGRGPARAPPPPAPPPPRGWAPCPPPLPTLRPVAPGARARTHASPGSMQMRYPGAGGPGRGERGKGVVLVRAPERAPGTCSLLLCCLLHTPTSRLAERSGLARADPLLAAPAANVPAPLIGHRTLSARPACGLSHFRLTSTRRARLWGLGGGVEEPLSLHRYVPETQLLVQATPWCEPYDSGKVAPVWTSCCVHIKTGFKGDASFGGVAQA